MSMVSGCVVIENKKNVDNRGFFSRVYCSDELRKIGKIFECKQTSIAHNEKINTVRGLHLQGFPDGESKIVTCISGAAEIFILDARIGSPTYRNVFTRNLASDGETTVSVYVPKYCAFGYITLTDNCNMLYYMDTLFVPENQKGYNIKDPSLGIKYDFNHSIISKRDLELPLFSEAGGI